MYSSLFLCFFAVVVVVSDAHLCVCTSLQTPVFHEGFHCRQNKLGKPVRHPFLFTIPLGREFYSLIYWIFIFSSSHCHLTPGNFFPLGVKVFFNLAFVQTFFSLLLSGGLRRRRCKGRYLSCSLSSLHQEGFP